MLDVDTFLTTLYVLVDECDKTILPPDPPTPGPAPALARSEALTLALFGQWGTFASERAFYRYAERHLRPAFPTLPTRSQYNRHLRRLTSHLLVVSQWVVTHLVVALRQVGIGCAYEVVDSLGVAVRHNQRRGRGWLPGQAARGYCNRLGWYVGFHVLTVCTPQGLLTGFGLAPGNSGDAPLADTLLADTLLADTLLADTLLADTLLADTPLADTLLAVRQTPDPRLPEVGQGVGGGYYLADTGFEGKHWAPRWRQEYHATVLIPPKRGTPRSRPIHPWPRALRRAFAGWRQIVETVHATLLHAFGLTHERPHTRDGFRARLAARVALHNCCCWLNHCLGRPLLAFADLLDW